jgi:N-acyl-D-aspartate/D-glutamate deacylase
MTKVFTPRDVFLRWKTHYDEYSQGADVAQDRWHNVLTTDTSAISDADGTQGIVSSGGNFTGTARPMTIRVYQVVTRHRVLVVVVHVVTRLRILQWQQTVNTAVLQQITRIAAEPIELFHGLCTTNPFLLQQLTTEVHKFSKNTGSISKF